MCLVVSECIRKILLVQQVETGCECGKASMSFSEFWYVWMLKESKASTTAAPLWKGELQRNLE